MIIDMITCQWLCPVRPQAEQRFIFVQVRASWITRVASLLRMIMMMMMITSVSKERPVFFFNKISYGTSSMVKRRCRSRYVKRNFKATFTTFDLWMS